MEQNLERTIGLIKKIKIGDKEALNLLFNRYYERIMKIVRLRLGTELKAKLETQDIAQEVFVNALKSFDKFTEFEHEGAFLHWLSKIVENTIRDKSDYFKAQKRSIREEIPLEQVKSDSDTTQDFTFTGNDPTPSKIIEKQQEIQLLENAILKLPETEREVIIMCDYEELTYIEAGEKIGKSPDAVRMMHTRVIAKLTKILEESGINDK